MVYGCFLNRITGFLLALTALLVSPAAHSQRVPGETFATGRLVVTYRNGAVPANADAIAAFAGARSVVHLRRLGLTSLQVEGDESAVMARLRTRPEIASVLHDRLVSAGSISVAPIS